MFMQTHTKKSGDCQAESTTSVNTVLAAVEPPPFGTCHAVCTHVCCSFIYTYTDQTQDDMFKLKKLNSQCQQCLKNVVYNRV